MRSLGIPLTASEGLPYIDEKDRFRHCYVLGATRSGKTNFFLSLLKQETDNAIILLDPAGTFAPRAAALAPADKVVYVDKSNPIVINPLKRTFLNKSERANELGEVINAAVKALNPVQVEITVQMQQLIRNAIKSFNDSQCTLEYLSDFLINPETRKKHFNFNPPSFWKLYDSHTRQGIEMRMSGIRIAARLSLYSEDETVRRFIIGNDEFDLAKIAQGKKVVCFNLHGLDDEAMAFVGNLVSHAVKSYYLHQATEDSPPLYFYADEFHLFISPFFQRMLAECGKFNISVNLSHHSHAQVPRDVLEIVLNSCYLKCVLACNADEAERMAREYQLKAKEFLDLKDYRAYTLIGKKPHLVLTTLVDVPSYIPSGVNFLRDAWISVV